MTEARERHLNEPEAESGDDNLGGNGDLDENWRVGCTLEQSTSMVPLWSRTHFAGLAAAS